MCKTTNIIKLWCFSKQGYTFAELTVAVAIILTLTTSVIIGSIRVSERAQATHIANDLKNLKTAWTQYALDTEGPCVDENDPSLIENPDPELSCRSEPMVVGMGLFENYAGLDGWNGPYIQDGGIAVDPWERFYSYDNDTTNLPYNPNIDNIVGASRFAGVNLFLSWCNQVDQARYIRIAEEIDDILDSGDWGVDGDPSNDGNFRWDTAAGRQTFAFLLAPDGRITATCPN